MRYFILSLMLALTLCLTSCGNVSDADRLAYQDSSLHVEAIFVIGDESVPVILNIGEAEYDEHGRMLARNATLTFDKNSMISGISFELSAGRVYISSGDTRIPIEDPSLIGGISDMVSLFCISPKYYHTSERVRVNGVKCERSVYVNGENSVEVLLDLSTMLPTEIKAVVDGREMSAQINVIKAE